MEGYRGLGQLYPVQLQQPVVPQAEITPYELGGNALGESQIARGIRSAFGSAKAGLQGYGASIADVLGAQQTAQDWYANANATAQQAEHDAPRVRTIGAALESPGNFVDYAAGKFGEFAPYLLLGGGAGLAGRGLGAVAGLRGAELARAGHLAGAASFQPVMAGQQALQMHNDPAARDMTPGEIALRSQGVGAVQAATEAAVPNMMVGQVLTRTTAPTIGRTLGTIAKNSLAGGASEGVSDVIGQMHQGTYDPRYRFNPAQTGEAVAAGIVGGAPITAAHGALTHGLDVGVQVPGKALDKTQTEIGKAWDATKQKASNLIDVIPQEYKDTFKQGLGWVKEKDLNAGDYYDKNIAPVVKVTGAAASALRTTFIDAARDLKEGIGNEMDRRDAGLDPKSLNEIEQKLKDGTEDVLSDLKEKGQLVAEVAKNTEMGSMFKRVRTVLDLAKVWEKAADPSKHGLSWLRAGEDKMTPERLAEIKKAMSNRAVQVEYADFIKDILDKAGEDNQSANELRGFAQRLKDAGWEDKTPAGERTSPLNDTETMRMFTAARVALETMDATQRLNRVLAVDKRLSQSDTAIPEDGRFSMQGAKSGHRQMSDAMREAGVSEDWIESLLRHVQDAHLLRDGADRTTRTAVTKGVSSHLGVEPGEVKSGGLFTPLYNALKPILEARLATLKSEAPKARTVVEEHGDDGLVSDNFKQKVGEQLRTLFGTGEIGKEWLSEADGGQSKIDGITDYLVGIAEDRDGYNPHSLMTHLKGVFGTEATPFIESIIREANIEFGGVDAKGWGKEATQSTGLGKMLEAHDKSSSLATKIALIVEDGSMDRRPAGGRRRVAPLPASDEPVVRRGTGEDGDLRQEGMLTLGSGERFSKYALAERLIEDLRQAEHLDNLGKRIEKYARQLGEEADKIIGRDKESLNKRNDLRRRALALLDHISVNDAFFDPEKPGTSKLKRQWVDEGIITAANFEPLLDLIKQYEGAKRLTKAEGGKANHKTSASKTAEIDPENHDEQQAIAEQGEVSGLEESQNAEKGQQGSTQEPPRFYGTRGTAREEGKKYDPFNIGAPVADHTSGDYKTTQSTELGAALDAHFGQGRLSERRPVRMDEWAEEMSSTYGGTPRSHLNRALEELLVHDKERLKNEKLDERSKSFLKSRADEAEKLRTGSGKLVEDAGELFFAMKMNSPYRYHRVAPHDASNLAYTRDQLEKSFGIREMTPEAWARDRATFGSFAKQVYLDSLLKVRDADGDIMNLDFARAVTKELQHHQSGDIAGVGDKRMDQGKAEAIMAAAYNILSAIITADGIAGKMVDGKFVPNKDPLRVKGGRTFESEDATMRESAEPRMYHLHRNNKTWKLEISNSAGRAGHELRGSTSATSWIQAKYNFGFELNPLQDQMLHLGLGKDQVHLDSNLVVYREQTPVHTVQPGEPVREVNPATPRFYTVGQLRGIIGRKDGKTVKESPTNKSPGQISDADIETMVTRVEQRRRVSTKMRDADNERGIARQGIEKDGELFNLNLNKVLVRMLERNGINVFDALHKEHFPVETAGMLMREAFKELQAKGYTGEIFNLGSEAFDDLALYKKEYADGEKHPVQWRKVKNIVANEQRNTPRTLEDALAYETISRMVAADKAEADVVERRANGALKDADTSPIAVEDRLNKTEKAYQAYDDGVYAPFRDPDAPDNELKFSEALQKIGSLVDYRGNNKDVPLQDKSDAVGGFRDNEPLKNMTESYDEEVAIQQRVAAKTPEQRAADKAARVEAQAYDYVKSMFDKALRAVKGHPELESFVKETFNMPFLDKAGEGLNPEFKAWLDAKAEKIAEGNKADFENILRELHGPDWAQKASKMDAAYDRQKSVPHNPDLVNSFGVTAKSTLPNKVSVEKTRGSGARVPGESALPFEVIARRGEIAQGRPGVNDLRVKVTSLDMSQPQGSGRTAESRLGPAPVEEAPAEAVKPFNAKEIAADLAAQKPKATVTNDLINSLSDAQLRDVLLNLGSRTDVAGSAADQVIRVMARSEKAETLKRLGLEYDEISEKFGRSLFSDAPFSMEGGVGANLGAREREPIHEAVLNWRVKELLGNMFSAKVVDVIMDGDKPTRYAGKFVNKVVEIWQHAPNMAGTLHHEIWHAVEGLLKDMGPHGEKILADIHKHMDTPLMRKRLMEAYADEGVNSQLGDMSERAAFVFQKLSEGVKFPMIKETTSLLGHLADFVKWVANKVGFKTTTAEERSNNFMDYVMKGDFARDMDNAASVRKGLGEKNGDNIVHQAGQILKPGLEALSAVFQHTSTRIADLKIPEYDTVMELLAGKSGKGGYMNDKRRMEYIFDNEIGNAIKGMSEEEMQKFRDTAEFKAFQGKVEQYMLDAGVNPTQVLAFYDRLATLNADMVGKEMEAFITDLVQHGGFKGKAGEARTLANQIADRGFYYDKDRDLFPNRPDLKEKWTERDFTQSMARYISTAVELAEKTRERDGNDGKKYRINDLGALLEAGSAKADSAGQKLMEDTLAAYNGTLASDKLSPGLRKFMGSLLFINNVRILPKAVFSQMLEPLQLAARRGTMSGTLDTLWRGIREMPRSFDWADSHYTPDKWEQLANQIGTAPSRIIANVMAQMHNGMTLPGKIGHWNDQFFKLNFMDQWNRSMHIEATKHGVEFLKEHAAIVRTSKNKGQVEHSQRLLNDLGVKVSDIKVDGDGGLFIDYENVGSDRVARAISQFVNEGMAHPDAGSNPMWMNDPRWALLAQMKRFTFAHAKYVLDPGIREYKLGNAFPVIPAVIAMPWMMAADGLRDTITMADTSYKNNWGFMDYAEHAWARSGNAGRGQFFGDVEQSVRHGGSGLEGVAGPTAELFGRIARGAHTGQWFDSMVNQVPGAQIVMPD